jgi:hypothetical protein
MNRTLLLTLVACLIPVSTALAGTANDRATGKTVVAVASAKKVGGSVSAPKPALVSTAGNAASSDYQLERDSCCIGN